MKIITFESVVKRIKTVLRESLLGPEYFELDKEFLPAYQEFAPDLEWEGRSVRDAGLTADKLVDFIVFQDPSKSERGIPGRVSKTSKKTVSYLRMNKTVSGKRKKLCLLT